MLVQAAPLMLVLFLLFPRVQGPLWGMPQDAYSGVTGLSEDMSPGSVSNLLTVRRGRVSRRTSNAAAIPATQQLYWRGPVMWDFDGHTWSASRTPYVLPRTFEALDSGIEYTVTVEPHGKRWLFALDLPAKRPPRSVDDERLSGAVSGRAQQSPALRHDFAPALPRCRGVAAL